MVAKPTEVAEPPVVANWREMATSDQLLDMVAKWQSESGGEVADMPPESKQEPAGTEWRTGCLVPKWERSGGEVADMPPEPLLEPAGTEFSQNPCLA